MVAGAQPSHVSTDITRGVLVSKHSLPWILLAAEWEPDLVALRLGRAPKVLNRACALAEWRSRHSAHTSRRDHRAIWLGPQGDGPNSLVFVVAKGGCCTDGTDKVE